MMNEEKRMKLYQLNNENRTLRTRMARALEYTREGDFDRASHLLEETRSDFDAMKKENDNILDDGYVSSVGFTEIFHQSAEQANRLYSRNCSAVKFYVYS